MADQKLSELTELAATPANDDEVYIRDVSEAVADESKRITIANLIAAKAVAAVEAAGLALAAAKKIIIADDGVIQLGTLTGSEELRMGKTTDPWEATFQPKDGNTIGEIGILPKGTEDTSLLSLHNDEDHDHTGFLQLVINGVVASLQGNKVGTGTAPTSFQIAMDVVPRTTLDYGLGVGEYWWSQIQALTYHILSGVNATHPVTGTVVNDLTAGENLILGDAVYKKVDGKMWKSDADLATTMPVMALATDTIAADADGKFLLQGYMYKVAWDWTIGGIIYASVTPGTMSQTAPVGSGDQVQVVGIGETADIIYFNPSYELVEIS